MRAEGRRRVPAGARRGSRPGDQQQLQLLITREWVASLAEADRREHPLGGYLLTAGFLQTLGQRAEIPLECVAWACAVVACGYAPALRSLARQPLLTARAGAHVGRADGAEGWRCNLQPRRPGGAHLRYWMGPGTGRERTVEFARLVGGDELSTV